MTKAVRLLADLDRQIQAAADEPGHLVAASLFKILTMVRAWARSGSGTTPVPHSIPERQCPRGQVAGPCGKPSAEDR